MSIDSVSTNASEAIFSPVSDQLSSSQPTWIDENTGRRVWQVTNSPEGALIGYFRFYKHLPDGRMLIHLPGGKGRGQFGGRMGAVDPATGDVEILEYPGHYLKLRISDGQVWFLKRPAGFKMLESIAAVDRDFWRRGPRDLWTANLPGGEAQFVAQLPEAVARQVSDITCDGSTLILEERHSEKVGSPVGSTEVEKMWAHFRRVRNGAIHAYDIASQTRRTLVETQDTTTFHVDTSPVDPTLVRYAHDMLECTGQRMFTVRTDGSELHPIRVQELGEMITHEFWWGDPNYIGYTYQDRRGDTTIHDLPWAEYAPVTTHLGVADLAGNEVFLSDPLNSYHSHLYVSRRGDLVCGEGTDDNSFVFAAPFAFENTKVDFSAMATIHTPYHPMSGQSVNSDFSADGKWLLFNDRIDGKMQVCRVQVDF